MFQQFYCFIMQAQHICQHFKNLKFTRSLEVPKEPACRYCMVGLNYIWICLAKNCGAQFCDRNLNEHIKMHLEDSKKKKLHHSIFINALTAQIICIDCQIQIYDLDTTKSGPSPQQQTDPFSLRLKVLPWLGSFDRPENKIVGQLQNSEGHRKVNKALIGFFGNRHNYAINSALQFLMQFQLFREIVFCVRDFNNQIHQLQQIFYRALSAEMRAVHTDELANFLFDSRPELLGYARKDPFHHVMYFMTKIHQYIKYYSVDFRISQNDEWDLLGHPAHSSKATLNCPLFDNTSITLDLNYTCEQCKRSQSLPCHVNFLKLGFPKKKRKAKEVQKQLLEHKFASPVKKRRNSLLNLFQKQQQVPLTVPELLIDFVKQPYHKDKICSLCKQMMHKSKITFRELPEYLLLQINRMRPDGNSINDIKVQFSTCSIDMGALTSDKQTSVMYNFETAMCYENACSFPVVAISRFNKQPYIFRNQLVTMLKADKQMLNPYILCYKKAHDQNQQSRLKDCHLNLVSNIDVMGQNSAQKGLLLPDFWLPQIKCGIARPLHHQLVCRHGRTKPNVLSKMRQVHRVPVSVYEYVAEMFQGKVFEDTPCGTCQKQLGSLVRRKKLQKQKLISYEKLKTDCSCMVSNAWIKKWIQFLYKKQEVSYMSKGYPMPGPIENQCLLEGQKFKPNLVKNQDFKVVSIYTWKFLKELYGGGPQIHYKWKRHELTQTEEQQIRQIRQAAREIRQIYNVNWVESPGKSALNEKTTSFVSSVRGSEQNSQLSLPQQKSE